MARQVAPGNAPEIKANQFKVDMPDFKILDEMGDAKIKSANANFRLYATMLLNTESAKLYEQYKTDPVQLTNGLAKLGKTVDGLPPELQEEFKSKVYLTSISLIDKAETNRLIATDLDNKEKGIQSAELSKGLIAQSYQTILRNNISKPEDKRPEIEEVYAMQSINLDNIANLQDHNGKNLYSESQRKQIVNTDDLKLDGFKQFFDGMLINDDNKLTQSKDYYQQFMLAPERFMKDNYMNRETYDKARAYAEKELKRAGAEIKDMQHKQSVKQFMELQIEDLPGRVAELRESGWLPKGLIDNMERVNVKFNEIDPSKTESPVAMLDLLKIVNDSKHDGIVSTPEQQQKILEEGTATLDAIAEYAQTYGLSPEKVKELRETVVNWETDTAFAPILKNFGDIVDNFPEKLATVRAESTGKKRGKYITQLDGLSLDEQIKLKRLNDVLAVNTDKINQLIRAGDWEGVRKVQRDTQIAAAMIKYDWIDWESIKLNPKQEITRDGRVLQIVDYTFDGDIQFKIM